MLRLKPAVDDSLGTIQQTENRGNWRAIGWRSLWGLLLLLCAWNAKAQTNIVTQHYDNSRTGANTNETILTPANVNSNTFGKLFSYSVDGQVYAQPLYVSGVTMGTGTPQAGTTHNVVFVATEHDSVYAFDADSNAGANAAPLWQITLLDTAHGAASGATTVATASGDDIYPEIGITGTPVIDPTTGTLYVVGATQEGTTYVQRLHALDITTGSEKAAFNSPVALQASVPGTGNGSSAGVLNFDPYWENQRPGLLFLNGIVYIGYSAHNDEGPWHGWILAYNGATLQQSGVFCTTPNGLAGGTWMSGTGLAADVIDPVNHPYGRMFIPTGNGSFTATAPPYAEGMSFSDGFIRMDLTNGALTPVDSFTPFNQSSLSTADQDTASGGVVLLPDQSVGGHTHLLVQTGKEGRIFLVDRDNMGGYSTTSDAIVQEIPAAPATTGFQINGIWGAPAYWNGNVYFWTVGDHLKAFSFTNGQLSATYNSSSNETIGYPGSTPAVSASGTTNGIVWAIDASAFSTPGPAILMAHDALNAGTTLYSSSQILALDNPGNAVKFAVPVVVNGKVYMGAQSQVSVYGLLSGLPAAATPTFSPAAGSYSGPQTVTINDATPGAAIFYTTDGTTPTTSSAIYSGALTVSTAETIQAIARASGFQSSAVASATYTFPVAGGQIQINSGGGAAGTFVADMDFSGGNASSVTSTINTSTVTNPAPQAVYQTERWGVFTYTIPNLTPSSNYKVRLHFAELAFSSPGQRVFNVAINGTTVLSNFDIVAAAGGSRKAVIEEFTPTTDALGRLIISYQQGSVDFPKSSGIEIIPLGTSSDFTVTPAPSSESLVPGGSTTYTVSVGAVGSFTGSVGLSASGLPAGATASFSPSAIGPGASSTLTVTTASSTPVGAPTVTITGTSGSLTHATTVSLNVTAPPDFTISATPSSQTITVGGSTTYTVNVGALNGFSGTVGLSVGGLPTGTTAGFSPTSLTGSGTSTLTVTTSSSTPAGSPSLTITGTSGLLTHTATVTLVVNAVSPPPDFSITATPSSQSVNAGVAAAYTVTVGALNGFSGTVGLSAGGLPTGAAATFNPTSTTTSGSSTLTVNTASTTPGGTYSLVVTGTSGSVAHTASVSLTVNAIALLQINSGGGAAGTFVADTDFSSGSPSSVTSTIDTSAVTNPAPQAVYQTERWGVFTYTIPNLTPNSAYKVRLHFAELAFSGTGQRIFSVAINGTTVLTNFDIVAAAGGSLKAVIEEFTPSASATGQIVISYIKGSADYPKSSGIEIIPLGTSSPDFTVTASPTPQSVVAGGSVPYTVNVGALNGFSGTVGLSVGGLPTGTTATINPSSVNGAGSSTLTVTTASTTQGGTYSLVITGTSGSIAHTASVSLTVQLQINSGGAAAGSFLADEDFSGGNASSVTFTIDTSAVTNPAPQAVYQTERWGVFTYTIPNLAPNATYKVRLHFAELAFSSPGQRVFNVAINGTTVLTNFDIVAAAGSGRKAIIEEFTPTANATGQIVISYMQGSADYPKSSGIEVIPQ